MTLVSKEQEPSSSHHRRYHHNPRHSHYHYQHHHHHHHHHHHDSIFACLVRFKSTFISPLGPFTRQAVSAPTWLRRRPLQPARLHSSMASHSTHVGDQSIRTRGNSHSTRPKSCRPVQPSCRPVQPYTVASYTVVAHARTQRIRVASDMNYGFACCARGLALDRSDLSAMPPTTYAHVFNVGRWLRR